MRGEDHERDGGQTDRWLPDAGQHGLGELRGQRAPLPLGHQQSGVPPRRKVAQLAVELDARCSLSGGSALLEVAESSYSRRTGPPRGRTGLDEALRPVDELEERTTPLEGQVLVSALSRRVPGVQQVEQDLLRHHLGLERREPQTPEEGRE